MMPCRLRKYRPAGIRIAPEICLFMYLLVGIDRYPAATGSTLSQIRERTMSREACRRSRP